MKIARNPHTIRKHNVTAALFCMVGIALNLLLGAIVTRLGLPLYLDTVGTVATAVLGGYLPGVIVGFATNIIKSISDPSSLYYGALNVLIAVFATRLAHRGWLKKPLGIFGLILVFTLIGGGLGALIPWFMDGLSFDSESVSGMLYATGHFSMGASHMLASLIMDLPDKAITVFLVLLIQRLIPDRFFPYFDFKIWMQAPISGENEVRTGKTKVRKLSLRAKITIVLSVTMVSVAVVITAISLTVYRKTLIKEHMRIAQGTA